MGMKIASFFSSALIMYGLLLVAGFTASFVDAEFLY